MNDDIQTQLEALQSDDPQVRAAAADRLGRAKVAEAVEPLFDLLDDADGNVRLQAAYALRRIRDPRASLHMIRLLNDEEVAIRRTASTWFMTLTGNQSRLVEPLCDIMLEEDSRASTRDFAAMLLGKYGDERAVEPLHQLIRQYPRIRLRAAQSLQRMADPRSIPLLIPLLQDGDMRVQNMAAKTLEAIGTPDALDAVARWRKHRAEQPPD